MWENVLLDYCGFLVLCITYFFDRGPVNKVVESFRNLLVEEQEVSQQTGTKTAKPKTGSVRQSASASNIVR